MTHVPLELPPINTAVIAATAAQTIEGNTAHAAALGELAAALRQSDGFPLELGPRTAERRVTARRAAQAADAAREALEALNTELAAFVEAWGDHDR
jgi:hypothetical protein